MYSDTGNTTSLVLGFPIRTSSDQRSVGSSPRHIAASHVLHRPLMPRHPPCALKHLQHKNQLLKIEITPQQPTTNSALRREPRLPRVDARNHYPRIKHHTPPPKPGATTRLPPHTVAREERACCLKAQQCVWRSPPPPKGRSEFVFVMCTRPPPTTGVRPSHDSFRSR
jgi:hypothetical protein